MNSERPSRRLTRMRSKIDIPADDPRDDQEFLDWAFEQAVQRFEEGLSVSTDDLLRGRESLRAPIEELIRTARQVSIGAPPVTPAPVIGGFTLLHEIGHGGMGTVYLARQEALGGRLVALKVLPWTFATAARSLERFRNEANAITRLRHPNIVAVYDIVHDGETHAFAMEWVEGSSLARLIDHLQEIKVAASNTHHADARIAATKVHLNAPAEALLEMSWPAYIIRIGIAIARALETVHQAGLLHRDVKPANILIRRDGTPLLSDFGLVRESDATVTQPGSFAGTACYAAPEQLRGDAAGVDRRADVYSLGVTLYHALTLRLPFIGHSATNLLRQMEVGAAPPLRRINRRLPVDLQTIIAKAMEGAPASRYQTADDLADDLQRVLNLQPIKAKPAGVFTRSLKLLRRNRRALIGACVGGGLAVALGVLLTLWLVFFPRWSEAHLREARLALLDQGQSNSIFNIEFFGLSDQQMAERGYRVLASPESLRLALDSYNAALRLRPFDQIIRQERDIVSISQQSPGIAMSGRSDLTTDDRSRGLAAFLHGDIDASLQAWSKYESNRGALSTPDPFIEAATGVMFLVRGEAPRAYPRLREACRAFPDSSTLMLMLADAAVQCGDLDQAGELLTRAGEPSSEDLLRGFERVRANLLAAQGRDAEAEAAYISAMRMNLVAKFQFGQFLESRGRIDEALAQYQRVIAGVPNGLQSRRAFIHALNRWWAGLDVSQRAKLLISTLDFPRPDQMDFLSLLRNYECSVRMLEQKNQRAGWSSTSSMTADESATSEFSKMARTRFRGSVELSTQNTGPRTARLAGFDEKSEHSAPLPGKDSSPILQRVSLSELAQRMEITNMNRWNRIVSYPRALKLLQSLAWVRKSRRPFRAGSSRSIPDGLPSAPPLQQS